MKRIFALIFALVICFSFVACSTVNSEKSDLSGLYRYRGGGKFFDDISLSWDKFYKLNEDGSGNIYYEFTGSHPDISEETKNAALESVKESITWREEDGYLVITYSDGDIQSFEKNGVQFLDISKSSYVLTKIS